MGTLFKSLVLFSTVAVLINRNTTIHSKSHHMCKMYAVVQKVCNTVSYFPALNCFDHLYFGNGGTQTNRPFHKLQIDLMWDM